MKKSGKSVSKQAYTVFKTEFARVNLSILCTKTLCNPNNESWERKLLEIRWVYIGMTQITSTPHISAKTSNSGRTCLTSLKDLKNCGCKIWGRDNFPPGTIFNKWNIGYFE